MVVGIGQIQRDTKWKGRWPTCALTGLKENVFTGQSKADISTLSYDLDDETYRIILVFDRSLFGARRLDLRPSIHYFAVTHPQKFTLQMGT